MSSDRSIPIATTDAADATSAIGAGSVCLGCAYDLQGLSPEGQCPECGKPIAESLSGDLLAFADPRWLRKVHRGLRRVTRAVTFPLLFASLSVILAVLAATLVAAKYPIALHHDVASFILAALFWINVGIFAIAPLVALQGWFQATKAEPHRQDADVNRLRLAVRWSAFAWFLILIASLSGVGLSPMVGSIARGYEFWVLLGIHALASAVHYWFAMSYLRVLSNRVPANQITRQAGNARVGLVVATSVGTLACGLGPIGGFIYYLAVLDAAHNAIRRIMPS